MPNWMLDDWTARKIGWTSPLRSPRREDIRNWQFATIRNLVEHARTNSPFYRAHLQGCNETLLRCEQDMSHLPFTDAAVLRSRPERLLCASQDEVARVVTLHSSGTTGAPKRLFYHQDDLGQTMDFFAHGMQHMVAPGDGALILLPGTTTGGVSVLLCKALECFGATGIAHGPVTNVGRTVQSIMASQAGNGPAIRCIVGSPAHVNALALEWKRQRLPLNIIRSVLLCWDNIPEAVAYNIENGLGAQVLQHWGMVETGLGGAVSCCHGTGMHIRETDLYIEIVDPKTDAILPAGETGELVVTTLSRRIMPLIRYRTGDKGRLLPTQCSCGSPLGLLDRLQGRIDANESVSISSLNELYGIDGLVDFAAYMNTQQKPSLHLALSIVRGASEHAIRNAVFSLDNLWKELLDESLELSIEIVSNGNPVDSLAPAAPGLPKRRLYHVDEVDEQEGYNEKAC